MRAECIVTALYIAMFLGAVYILVTTGGVQ